MLEFLKRLFGAGQRGRPSHDSYRAYEQTRQATRSASDRYFNLLTELRETVKGCQWDRGSELAHALMDVLPDFIREQESEYGGVPPNLPVFTEGARALVMTDDGAGLQRLLRLTAEVPQPHEWKSVVVAAMKDRENLSSIREVLATRPGVLQRDIKEAVGADDGRRVSTLLYWLDKSGEIRRLRYKNTYVLGLPGVEIPLPDDHAAVATAADDDQATETAVTSTFDQAHTGRRVLRPTDIDLTRVEYIPLPRAPMRWEEHQKKAGGRVEADDYFELDEGTPWELGDVQKLSMEERPETAYRKLAPHAAGAFLIDDVGKVERFPEAPAALISVTRGGEQAAEAPLGWGMYRWEVNPMGSGFIAMDRAGVLHAYDHQLNRILATPLSDAPEMAGLMDHYDFSARDLRNYTRAVALSPSGDRYLFTVVDRVHVIGIDGDPLWSVQLPKREGWTRVTQTSERAGTSAEISRALTLLDLELPISVEDVRSNYRQLAKQWHPDVNQGSKEAEEHFKAISNAAEMLSGVDLSSLAPDVSRAMWQQVQEETSWEVDGVELSVQLGIGGSERQASDWIYAAGFATDGGAYLAGYSGRVVRTDPDGRALRAYDIGAVPRRIADTGDYLYFLTDTRLYILADRSLVRLLDVFDEGELIVGQTGFGLLDKKRFRWFTETGEFVGTVLANNPIRRVYSTPEGLVVETRQRRVLVSGAPMWWEA